MPPGPGILQQLIYRWKSLKLPWRKQFLIGADLSGNTFWEFQDALNANRFRRIVHYPRQTHYADIKISPQWHQWLRHTRDDAPTLQEQQYEVSRQEMMKVRAREADERWKSVPSYLDKPKDGTGTGRVELQQPEPAVGVHEPLAGAMPKEDGSGVIAAVGDQEEVREASEVGEGGSKAGARSTGRVREREKSPWDRDSNDKAEQASWVPGVAKRRA